MNGLCLCHTRAWGRRTPGTSLQGAQLLRGHVSPARQALSSVPLSCPRGGQEASHTMPGAVSGRPAARRHTGARSAFSLSSLPSFCHHRAHLSCFRVRALPCCRVRLKLAGGFKPYRGWLIDRQIDNMIVRAPFL